jgi:hypothetical protein
MVFIKVYKNHTKTPKLKIFLYGKGGIRTLGDREATPIFKIGAINHSATFP